MKKQYRYSDENLFYRAFLYIYHDGILVDTKRYWSDELYEEIKKLEQDGYTYGYTKEEVEEAKQQYENMLENVI